MLKGLLSDYWWLILGIAGLCLIFIYLFSLRS